MRRQSGTVEQELARIVAAQHGIVTRAQLLSAGMSTSGVDRRLRKGSLLPEYRGVYSVGHRGLSFEARYLAAVLACGDGAVLSGRAAAHLLRIVKRPPPAPEATARIKRRVEGITNRRSRNLDSRDTMTWHGVPITTPARTLVDLAEVLGADDLARACHEAGIIHRTTPTAVEEVLERRPNCPGSAKLRRVLRGDVHVTMSKLEARFLALVRDNGLVLPVTNRPAGGRWVDCRWPEQRLTVELDGYRYHQSRHAWELDRRREREAHARGDEFRRYTYGDVIENPTLMLEELRQLIPRHRPA